jgi:hypothetical protein
MIMSEAGTQQFDFWCGYWDLTWGDNGRGSNEITRILDGRIIQENFNSIPDDDSPPYQGLSVSAYDAESAQWRQTWVDNQGGYLDFAGSFADGKMILSRDAIVADKPVKQRMVWQNIEADSLDWAWERSEDNGRSWQALWSIHYSRKK